MSDTDDAFDLDMAVATLQSNATDVRIMLKVLAGQLAEALGPRVVVERAGGLLRKSDEIKAAPGRRSATTCCGPRSTGASVRCYDRPLLGRDPDPQRAGRHGQLAEAAARRPAGKRPPTAETARQALENIMIGGTS